MGFPRVKLCLTIHKWIARIRPCMYLMSVLHKEKPTLRKGWLVLKVARLDGFEPPTCRLRIDRSVPCEGLH